VTAIATARTCKAWHALCPEVHSARAVKPWVDSDSVNHDFNDSLEVGRRASGSRGRFARWRGRRRLEIRLGKSRDILGGCYARISGKAINS
jgi:hypothetical protein